MTVTDAFGLAANSTGTVLRFTPLNVAVNVSTTNATAGGAIVANIAGISCGSPSCNATWQASQGAVMHVVRQDKGRLSQVASAGQ